MLLVLWFPSCLRKFVARGIDQKIDTGCFGRLRMRNTGNLLERIDSNDR